MPRLFRRWPHDAADDLTISQVRAMYMDGYSGLETNRDKIEAADGEFTDWINSQGDWAYASGEDAAYENNLVGSGQGKLTLLTAYAEQLFPGSLPGPPQQRGDCVSHSSSCANLLTLSGDLSSGTADSETGIVEGPPEITPDGIRGGVVSSCYTYWFRGYKGDGWQCSIAARVSTQRGIMLCQRYDDLDLDLTNYSGSLAGRYGRNPPPDEIEAVGRKHLIRTATRVGGYEQLRDLLANGYGGRACGGESWSSVRDECGVSKRTRQGWSHALGVGGVDDRTQVKRKYRTQGLVLLVNSWGNYNTGPREVHESDLVIPGGSFWTRYEDMKNRSVYAMSGANGWPAKQLPLIMEDW